MSDLKRTDLDFAEKETALYANHAAFNAKNDPDSCAMIIELAGSTKQASVSLHVIAAGKPCAIPIMYDTPWDETLLATISIAVTNLCESPQIHPVLTTSIPFRDEMSPMEKRLLLSVFG